MRHVTSKDIAGEAGVSQAAVSYVLTGRWKECGIREATRDRILAVAQRLGYRVNQLAQGLKSGKTRLLGMLAPCVTLSYFAEIVRGAEDVAAERNYILILMHTDEDPAKEAKKIEILRKYRVEGLLIIPAVTRRKAAIFRELQRDGVPFVLADKRIPGQDFHYVGTEDREGARRAVNYLISLGHRRIAHIRGPARISTSEERLAGYMDALRAHRLKPGNRLIVGGSWDENAGRDAARQLLKIHPCPTAIFAATDILAWGACTALSEEGLKVPDDVSLVGFADLDLSARLAVPLTTVHQPAREIGRRGAEKLLNLIEKGSDRPIEVRLPTELLIRDSCCPPGERVRK